eukprot:m.373209 g.373209  ORF g.373209 m.373209 type:complete len:234 (+) comp20885_c0_seq6:113-814(+)
MYFTVPCAGLEAMGLLENTVSIFTSDNGYHLGEHRLKFGKSEPYETDIRLPFFVAGVGVAKGQRRAHPTNHIDIGASLVDLAQASAHVPVTLDGKSFVPLLRDTFPAVADWRTFSLSEFYVENNTWLALRTIDPQSGEANVTFHWWCSNQAEVFMKATDPFEMNNVAATPAGQRVVQALLSATIRLGNCSGADCHVLNRENADSDTHWDSHTSPLQCHADGPHLDVAEALYDP